MLIYCYIYYELMYAIGWTLPFWRIVFLCTTKLPLLLLRIHSIECWEQAMNQYLPVPLKNRSADLSGSPWAFTGISSRAPLSYIYYGAKKDQQPLHIKCYTNTLVQKYLLLSLADSTELTESPLRRMVVAGYDLTSP